MSLSSTTFDAVAAEYDEQFSRTPLGRALRRRVWAVLDGLFAPGSRLLDLACGTGEDALWLAKRGVDVVATDGSPAMLRQVEAKARQADLSERVATMTLSWDQLIDGRTPPWDAFDGVLSNFGGLNVTARWDQVGAALAPLVRPGGHAVLVPMGAICPWEIGWHLARGRPAEGLRRLRQPATAHVGSSPIPIWYPSPRRLRAALSPYFVTRRVESLGLWLPPSYLGKLVNRRPGVLRLLSRLDTAFARPGRGLGDHFMLLAQRRNVPHPRMSP